MLHYTLNSLAGIGIGIGAVGVFITASLQATGSSEYGARVDIPTIQYTMPLFSCAQGNQMYLAIQENSSLSEFMKIELIDTLKKEVPLNCNLIQNER